eukprot:TRINITY_DN12844_c0_g1_i1.p1 TRINITY_DN12844_c0_g1~~TRINITY_DN12844_c0_g1_i1.p1  ORF type:complete len:304 (+),score=55.11 TRINITY_DN12844_c0_g1_i1:104-1015(+)
MSRKRSWDQSMNNNQPSGSVPWHATFNYQNQNMNQNMMTPRQYYGPGYINRQPQSQQMYFQDPSQAILPTTSTSFNFTENHVQSNPSIAAFSPNPSFELPGSNCPSPNIEDSYNMHINKKRRSKRNAYICSVCGLKKRGHNCPGFQSLLSSSVKQESAASTPTLSASRSPSEALITPPGSPNASPSAGHTQSPKPESHKSDFHYLTRKEYELIKSRSTVVQSSGLLDYDDIDNLALAKLTIEIFKMKYDLMVEKLSILARENEELKSKIPNADPSVPLTEGSESTPPAQDIGIWGCFLESNLN